MAIILAWLDDVLPGRAEREMPPAFGDEASQTAINSIPGQVLITWLALRDQGISYEQAAEFQAELPERIRLLDVLFHRRRTYKPSGEASDVAATWCGKDFASMVTELGIERVRALSLDQFEWLCSSGECDMHADPNVKNLLAWQDQWKRDNEAYLAEHPVTVSDAEPEYVIKSDNGEANNA
jgi:hypothetical protein